MCTKYWYKPLLFDINILKNKTGILDLKKNEAKNKNL